jgi:hypothetical protein
MLDGSETDYTRNSLESSGSKIGYRTPSRRSGNVPDAQISLWEAIWAVIASKYDDRCGQGSNKTPGIVQDGNQNRGTARMAHGWGLRNRKIGEALARIRKGQG